MKILTKSSRTIQVSLPQWVQIRISPFLKDIIITSFTSGIVSFSLIFIIAILSRKMPSEELGMYLFARRIISFLVPFVMISSIISLPRYVALANSEDEKASYVLSTVVFIIANSSLVLALLQFMGPAFANLLFKNPNELPVLYASMFLLLGYCLYSIVYGYYRGSIKFKMANIIAFISTAVLPLLIVYFVVNRGMKTANVLLWMGIPFYIVAVPILLPLSLTAKLGKLKDAAKKLLQYGSPRVLAGMSFQGLFLVGPFLSQYFGTLRDASFFIVGQLIYRILEAVLMPFVIVILPRIVLATFNKSKEYFAERVQNLLIFIFHLGSFITVQLFLFSPSIVQLWLGPKFEEAVPIIRILCCAVIPYLSYSLLRGIIDAVKVHPVNTINLLISLITIACLSIIARLVGMNMNSRVLAVCVGIGIFLLGFLSVLFTIHHFEIKLKGLIFWQVIAVNGILALYVSWILRFLNAISSSTFAVIFLVFIGGSVVFLYFGFLYIKKVQWMLEVKKRITLKSHKKIANLDNFV